MVRARKSRFLNVITSVAIVGIAFGVMMLTIVLSVTGGFQEAFRERILGLHPHLLVWPRDDAFVDYREAIAELERDPRILGATPATYDEMMIAHHDRRAGAVVKGTDLKTAARVLDVASLITEGHLDTLDERPTLAWEPVGVSVGNLVAETSWSLIIYGDRAAVMVQDDPTEPLPDEAHLQVVNADPALKAVDIALKAAKSAHTVGLAFGEVARPVALPVGTASVAVDEHPLAELPELSSGGRYLYVLAASDRQLLVPLPLDRPGEGEARLRVVDVRSAGARPLAVRVGADYRFAPTTGGAVASALPQRLVSARPPAIILGYALADRLNAHIGDRLAVSSPYRGLGSHGLAPVGMEPISGRFEVGGIFRSGYHDYDKRFALVAFDAAIRFLNTGDQAKWLEVKVDNVFKIDVRKQTVQDILQPYSLATFAADMAATDQRINAVLGGEVSQFVIEPKPKSVLGFLRNTAQVLTVLRTGMPHTFNRRSDYSVITWEEVNQPLFQALKLQKLVLSVFFLIIIVVAAFNIVGTQIMMVHQKTREIAILKALGASRWMVRRVFLIQGFIVASLGTLTGLFLGLGACLGLDRIGYPLEPEVYLIDHLPVKIAFGDISLVCVAALALTLLATMYSANRAGRLMPVDGIRYIE